MKTTLIAALATLTLGSTAIDASTFAPDRRAAAANRATAPQTLNAPRNGQVSAANISRGTISIGGQTYRIGEPYVAVIDKRPGTNGMFELKDLRPGMAVRYRVEKDVDGAERVVELWLVDPKLR
jgi:hypothetical protein